MATVSHFEIPAEDGDRARAFYAEAFGWTLDHHPEMSYTIIVTGPTGEDGRPSEPGHINGGMFTRQGQFADHRGPIVTVVVDDLDAALERVRSGGGSQFGDGFDVPGMGRGAYFTDTEGNVMGLWQAA